MVRHRSINLRIIALAVKVLFYGIVIILFDIEVLY
jgi:hypothetical protein